MDFPGICDKCPLGLICATDSAYTEKHLCHCGGCKQDLMVFIKCGGSILEGDEYDDMLLGLLENFECPHPYRGPNYLCPACEKERRRKEIEGD